MNLEIASHTVQPPPARGILVAAEQHLYNIIETNNPMIFN